MADLAGREHRLLGDLETGQRRYRADRLHIGQIICREDNVTIALWNMNGLYPGMRQRAANEGNILQARQSDIGNELATAAQKAVILLAEEPGANALSSFRRRG